MNFEEFNSELAPKATGCLIQSDDIPRICASLSAFGAQFGYGAGTALLGLTYPHFVHKFQLQASVFGPLIFSSAGIGLVVGFAVSYHARQTMSLNLSKISLTCLSIFFASILQLLVMICNDVKLLCILCFLQFLAFGCVEGFTLIALFEMWGQRIQPWIYSKTLSYSFGCLILSLFFRNKHWNEIYLLSAIMCLFPLFGLLCDFIYTYIRNKNIRNHSTIINHYSTFHSSSSPSAASGCEHSPSFPPSQSSTSPATVLRETIPTIFEEDFMSSEFVLLELAFDHVTGLSSVPHKVKTAVVNILDATEYCNVTAQQRKDPYFEPNIIKTLAYATKPLVNKLHDFQLARRTPPIPLLPPLFSLYISCLGVMYVSLFTLFVGWTPWYIIEYNQSIYQENNNSSLDHWNVMSLFYSSTMIGAVTSIPLSIWISTTTIFRLHLLFLLLSSLSFYCFIISLVSFQYFLTGTVLLGIGLGSISPSLLTLLNDYGYTCDDFSITFISLCSSFGMIVSSIVISYPITIINYHAIPAMCCLFGVLLPISYCLFHYFIRYHHLHSSSSASSASSASSMRASSISCLSYDQVDNTNTTFKSFNTYQRAQTMLIDRNSIFKFTRSSGDLSFYQQEQI